MPLWVWHQHVLAIKPVVNSLLVGDQRTLIAARQQIRQGFREKASLSASDPAAVEAIKVAKDIALILRHNVVQGQSEGNDLYRKLFPEQFSL